jgi:hypothetical protein
MVLTGEFGISAAIAWARRGLAGAQQRRRPLLDNRVAAVLPSQLLLTKGTPPSCATISANTACVRSGRWSCE